MSASGAGNAATRGNQVGTTARTSRLRLLADLRDMQQDPPEGCSASPYCEDSKFEGWRTSEEIATDARILNTKLTARRSVEL